MDRWICPELSPGREKYYVIFPSNNEILFPSKYENIFRIEVAENRIIEATTAITGINYFFDFQLNIANIRLSHRYQTLYNKKLQEKLFSKAFDHDALVDKLRPEIRYWNGNNWTETPTQTKYWLNIGQ